MRNILNVGSFMAMALFVCSCATVTHNNKIKPVSPKIVIAFMRPIGVDSLQPTLSWKSENPEDQVFDLAIYTSKNTGGLTVKYDRVKQIYYREAIAATSHKVEMKLEPGTVYVWGVRSRNGDQVGEWSTFDFFVMAGGNWRKGANFWWTFKTPRE